MRIEDLKAYEILEKRTIADVNSVSYILRHKKTNARVAILSNDDSNKVFYIGFRTPPKDSTGVAHIIEHTVLCGSEQFPVKDPFVELVKGSLNTFLNAMTYPDKTIFPVASVNEKDFQNLMHVYLDAVFHPNIYTNPSIFKQEGWHYELSEEGELTLNGVVYNEMKGAFSSPEDVLAREIMSSLYPDTTYGFESGGDPDKIPDLTYEDFLAFHQKYYHPSNSYIYLYGDMDMAEKLTFIDENYLSDYTAIEVDSEIKNQACFSKPVAVTKNYPIDPEEDPKECAYLSVNYSVADNNLDRELYVAFQILEFVLGQANGAPIRQALIDKGIGQDVYSSYDNGIMQPYFSIVAKDTSVDLLQEFLETIDDVYDTIIREGFEKDTLLAAINYYEFKYREADFGAYPKGLMYGLQMLDSWLYDDSKPFIHIEANETFRILRERVETGYYEELVKTYLKKNLHKSTVVLVPDGEMSDRMEKELSEKLLTIKTALSDVELAQIKEEAEKLRLFQETPDTPENLQKLPMLKREDLEKKSPRIINEVREAEGVEILYHDVFTNGIGYMTLAFDALQIPTQYYTYLGLLKLILGEVNTRNYSYKDLFTQINLWTGGMIPTIDLCSKYLDPDSYTLRFQIKSKVLYENMDKAMELMEEILLYSDFSDHKRLLEIIRENKSKTQSAMLSGGHSLCVGRALAYTNKPAAVADLLTGLGFYRNLCRLEENFETEKENITAGLTKLCHMLFRKENFSADYTADKQVDDFTTLVKKWNEKLYTDAVEKDTFHVEFEKKNEGLLSPSQVQYVCRAGNFRKKGLPYTGALRALKVMMGYDYLWVNVRVKGGAYGCMCNFSTTGESYFVSYRDPNVEKTIEVYEKASAYVKGFDADERTMTQYIIGAVSDLDIPMTPQTKGVFSKNLYLAGVTQEMLDAQREELLCATPADIRKLAAYIDAFMEDECLCVTGNSNKLKEVSEIFTNLENLF